MRLPLLAGLLVLSCRPEVAQSLDPQGVLAVERCSSPTVVATQLRRLTAAEFDATVRDVLKVDIHAGRAFPPEDGALFSNLAAAQIASVTLSEKLQQAAEDITAQVDFQALQLCVDDSCTGAFIDTIGRRLFRRGLSTEEKSRFTEFFVAQRSSNPADVSYRMLLQVMLLSPQFLFRIEPLPGTGSTRNAIAPVALASRLSFFLWGSAPDDALLHQAETGELNTAEQVTAVARLMLQDPRARESIARFHVEWLGVSRLTTATRNDSRFEALRQPLIDEVGQFGAYATLDDNSFTQLMSGRFTYMNDVLGSLYGVPIDGSNLRRVSTTQLQRGGLLTLGGVLSAWSKPNESSPVLRGKFVRERLLCEVLMPPPGNVVTQLAPVTQGTTRQRFSAHVTEAACSGCHTKMDPVGFGFEHYDAIGGYRILENGQPVDARGDIYQSLDSDGAFDGALALGQKLSLSQQARHCVALQWFRFAMGRQEVDADACTLDALDRVIDAPNAGPKDVILAIVASDAFRLEATQP